MSQSLLSSLVTLVPSRPSLTSSTPPYRPLYSHPLSRLSSSAPFSDSQIFTLTSWRTTISDLLFISKLLSGLINRSSPDQPVSHLQQPSFSSTISLPCRTDHSNETALLKITNDLLNASDRSEMSILTLLSAAFETTDHSILLQRLQDTCGIHTPILASLLYPQQKLIVSIDNIRSKPARLSCGVLQSSVHFTLYVQPPYHIIDQHSFMHQSFVDEIQLYNRTRTSPSNSFPMHSRC